MSDNKNLNEEELAALIKEKKAYIKENAGSLAPIQIQAIMDEIKNIENSINKIRSSKIKITPVIDAPLAKDHPKESNSRFIGNTMRL